MGMRYRDLKVWQNSMSLVEEIYKMTKTFPDSEFYSLTSQIKRSAVSIPSNIAKGKGRISKKEFINFLHIALGSLYELSTQIEIAKRLSYIEDCSLADNLIYEIDKMINSLILNRKNNEE